MLSDEFCALCELLPGEVDHLHTSAHAGYLDRDARRGVDGSAGTHTADHSTLQDDDAVDHGTHAADVDSSIHAAVDPRRHAALLARRLRHLQQNLLVVGVGARGVALSGGGSEEPGGQVERLTERDVLRPVSVGTDGVVGLLGVLIVGQDALPPTRKRSGEHLLGVGVQVDLPRPRRVAGVSCPQQSLVQLGIERAEVEAVVVRSLNRASGERVDECSVVDSQSLSEGYRPLILELTLCRGEPLRELGHVVQGLFDVDRTRGILDDPSSVGLAGCLANLVVCLDERPQLGVVVRLGGQGFEQFTERHLVGCLVERDLDRLLRPVIGEPHTLEQRVDCLGGPEADVVVEVWIRQNREKLVGHVEHGLDTDLAGGHFPPDLDELALDVGSECFVVRRNQDDLSERNAGTVATHVCLLHS